MNFVLANILSHIIFGLIGILIGTILSPYAIDFGLWVLSFFG